MSALSFGVLLVCLTLAPGDSSEFTAYSADSKYNYSMCGCTPSTEMNVRITVIMKGTKVQTLGVRAVAGVCMVHGWLLGP